jgi:hypothetical protein
LIKTENWIKKRYTGKAAAAVGEVSDPTEVRDAVVAMVVPASATADPGAREVMDQEGSVAAANRTPNAVMALGLHAVKHGVTSAAADREVSAARQAPNNLLHWP